MIKLILGFQLFTEGDCLARYFVRADEVRESAKIVKTSFTINDTG